MRRTLLSSRINWKNALDALTSIVMISAAIALIWWNVPNRRAQTRQPSAPHEPVSIEHAALKGASSADAVLIVFSDFECPFCGSFARDTMPQLEREYVTPGRLQVAYRYLPLPKHANAPAAAQAAECAKRQDQFWPMHDALFAPGVKLDAPGLQAVAASLDLDDSAYARCLTEETSKEAVSRDFEHAKALGLESTPAFLLGLRTDDGRVRVSKAFYGALPSAQFRTEIERAMAAPDGWFKRMFSLSLWR